MPYEPKEVPVNPNPSELKPDIQDIKTREPWRGFWVQKALPLVYDDSLSYYEVLCKVIVYINNFVEDFNKLDENVDAMYTAFDELQKWTQQEITRYETELNQEFDAHKAKMLEAFKKFQDEVNARYEEFTTKMTTEFNAFKTEVNTAVSEFKAQMTEWAEQEQQKNETFRNDMQNDYNSFKKEITDGQEQFKTELTEKMTTFENNMNTAWESWKTERESEYEAFTASVTRFMDEMGQEYSEFKNTLEEAWEAFKAQAQVNITHWEETALQNVMNYLEGPEFNSIVENYVEQKADAKLPGLVEAEVTKQTDEKLPGLVETAVGNAVPGAVEGEVAKQLETKLPEAVKDEVDNAIQTNQTITEIDASLAAAEADIAEIESTLNGTVPVDHGGTGATNAKTALSNLNGFPKTGGDINGTVYSKIMAINRESQIGVNFSGNSDKDERLILYGDNTTKDRGLWDSANDLTYGKDILKYNKSTRTYQFNGDLMRVLPLSQGGTGYASNSSTPYKSYFFGNWTVYFFSIGNMAVIAGSVVTGASSTSSNCLIDPLPFPIALDPFVSGTPTAAKIYMGLENDRSSLRISISDASTFTNTPFIGIAPINT